MARFYLLGGGHILRLWFRHVRKLNLRNFLKHPRKFSDCFGYGKVDFENPAKILTLLTLKKLTGREYYI